MSGQCELAQRRSGWRGRRRLGRRLLRGFLGSETSEEKFSSGQLSLFFFVNLWSGQDGQLEEWWLEGKHEGKDGEGEGWERSLRRWRWSAGWVPSQLFLTAPEPTENLMWNGAFENLLVTFTCLTIPVIVATFKPHQKCWCVWKIFISTTLSGTFFVASGVFSCCNNFSHTCVKCKLINGAEIKS